MGRYHLTLEPLGETVEVEDGQTILEACLRSGIWLPYACGHGRCGTCKVDVTGGDVDHGHASPFALMDIERADGKTLACCATLKSDATVEAEIEEDEDAENHPLRELTGRVTRLADLTPTVRGIWLAVPDDFAFQPGQYVNLFVPGLDEPRAFSIANAPSERGVIELHVRRVPDGKATTWLHESLKVGDELRLAGPYGRFFVRQSKTAPRIFIAGGSGLSSLQSMLLERLGSGCTVTITLIHGVRSVAELYHRETFEALAREHATFRYVPAISGDDAAHGLEKGFAHEVLERLYEGKLAGNGAYLCGPPPMVEACIRTLMKGRLFEKDIFTERFVTQGDGESALARSPLFKRI